MQVDEYARQLAKLIYARQQGVYQAEYDPDEDAIRVSTFNGQEFRVTVEDWP